MTLFDNSDNELERHPVSGVLRDVSGALLNIYIAN
jgi:hypothetical protein